MNRGFQPGTFFARRIAVFNFEYRFPLFRVDRGPGLLPAFLKDFNAALIADTSSSDFGVLAGRRPDLFRTFYTSAGVEIKSNWNFSYYLPTEVRLGLLHGFGPYGEPLYMTLGMTASL